MTAAAAFRIIVTAGREVVLTRTARSRSEADEILSRALVDHPDCQVALYVGDVVVLFPPKLETPP